MGLVWGATMLILAAIQLSKPAVSASAEPAECYTEADLEAFAIDVARQAAAIVRETRR